MWTVSTVVLGTLLVNNYILLLQCTYNTKCVYIQNIATYAYIHVAIDI